MDAKTIKKTTERAKEVVNNNEYCRDDLRVFVKKKRGQSAWTIQGHYDYRSMWIEITKQEDEKDAFYISIKYNALEKLRGIYSQETGLELVLNHTLALAGIYY